MFSCFFIKLLVKKIKRKKKKEKRKKKKEKRKKEKKREEAVFSGRFQLLSLALYSFQVYWSSIFILPRKEGNYI
jgi:phosphate/sulfate permease